MHLLDRKNTYTDNTQKRLHLNGIDAASEYLRSKSIITKIKKWLDL